MTLQAAIREFLIDQAARGNTERTVRWYEQSLGYFAGFSCAISLEGVTVALCKRYCVYLAESGVATTTRQSYVRALRVFLSWCYEEEYMKEDLTRRFRLPKAQRKVIDVLTDAELLRLFACFDLGTMVGARNYAMCALMLDSGLRLNEVITLPIGAVRLAERYMIVDGKGNKQRVVPLGDRAARAIALYFHDVPLEYRGSRLFLTKDCKPLKQSTVESLFRQLRPRAQLPRLHPHLLRHTFATRYLENGGDIYSLQQILGHTSLDMVRKYVHLVPSKVIERFPEFSPLDNLKEERK